MAEQRNKKDSGLSLEKTGRKPYRTNDRDSKTENKTPAFETEKIIKVKQVQGVSRVYSRGVDSLGRGYGTGRAKGTSVARVWVSTSTKSKSSFKVNNQKADEYFPREFWVNELHKPLKAVLMDDSSGFEVSCTTCGGGLSGQVRAIKLGLARALVVLNPNMKEVLKEAKLLTSDARVKERQKYGQRGARAKFPYNRR